MNKINPNQINYNLTVDVSDDGYITLDIDLDGLYDAYDYHDAPYNIRLSLTPQEVEKLLELIGKDK